MPFRRPRFSPQRNQRFFSLIEANRAIRERLEWQRPPGFGLEGVCISAALMTSGVTGQRLAERTDYDFVTQLYRSALASVCFGHRYMPVRHCSVEYAESPRSYVVDSDGLTYLQLVTNVWFTGTMTSIG